MCRRIRARPDTAYVYFILLTSLDASKENTHIAADAGVDDFLRKPLNADELWTRLRTAERILDSALRVSQLERLLPICSYCKKIRDEQKTWQPLEGYIQEHTGSEFSHSVCPDCYQRVVQTELRAMRVAQGKPPPPQP